MSYEQACQVVLIKAQNDAIAEAFGLSVSDENNIFISNINGKSSTDFHSATRGSVRGVWLAEPIRYMADKELATDVFKNNDNFFLYFKSPVDGYLTVFLFDIQAGQAFCLLPYQDVGTGSYPIKFNEEYYFFSPDHAKADDGKVDELVLTCTEGKPEEYNQLFIIFSPNKFAKKMSTIGEKQLTDDLVIPSSLEYEDFNKWLMKCQQKDEEMEVRRIPIKITHN